MALLTGTGATQRNAKFARFLLRGNTLICVLLYVAGLVYFWMLGHNYISNGTYFSENALLPGLVHSEINRDTVQYVQRLAAELEHERSGAHRTDTPHVWLQAKMRQLGLETYTQNFTLRYPLGGGRVFTGRNVYGILRAPRIGSTESFVLSVPYRPPDSLHPSTVAGVPMLLAFASHARKQKYWSKDLIFLITEQEQLGMQAWLEAYYGTEDAADGDAADAPALRAGSLEARAGSIQAAINLELPAFDISHIDVKIEGLNGALPNLDLLNVVQRIATKEGMPCGHQQRNRRRRQATKSTQLQNFQHMLEMVLRQATGVPNGNHGLFARYAVSAVTLEGHSEASAGTVAAGTTAQRDLVGAGAILKIVEGVARSVNNLLERFHQSFFFYLLVASDRFVSIGDYMPALAVMVLALLVKALIVWLQLGRLRQEEEEQEEEQESEEKVANVDEKSSTDISEKKSTVDEEAVELDYNFFGCGQVLLLVHAVGLLATYLPLLGPLNRYAHESGIRTEQFMFGLQTAVAVGAATIVPFVIDVGAIGARVLHVAVLLELATALLIVGMLNFAFAFTLAVFVVPPVLFVGPVADGSSRKWRIWLSRGLCGLLNPMCMTFGAVLAATVYSFPELGPAKWLTRATAATAEAITFAVVDSMIYGNWIFNVVQQILLPIWMCLWCVTFSGSSMAKKVSNK